jgi:NADH-quinone oxidoreductase subunit N
MGLSLQMLDKKHYVLLESFDQGSGHLYVADSLSQFTGVIILISFLVSLLLSIGYTSGSKGPISDFCKIEYPLIMFLAILGIFIISSNDFLTLYLALELSSLSLYVLSTFLPQNLYSTESGLKYFVLGSLASTIYLLGFSLIYGFSGLSNFNDLGLLIGLVDPLCSEGTHSSLLIGFALVTFGLLFKLGAVPFHSWLIDVYDGSPTPITTFFALTPKIAIITIIIRLGWSNTNIADGILSGGDASWSHIFYITAILSLIVGTIGAIGQTKIKRLLAYSAVNHIGFILIAFASGYDTNPSAILSNTSNLFLLYNISCNDSKPILIGQQHELNQDIDIKSDVLLWNF